MGCTCGLVPSRRMRPLPWTIKELHMFGRRSARNWRSCSLVSCSVLSDQGWSLTFVIYSQHLVQGNGNLLRSLTRVFPARPQHLSGMTS